MSFEGYIKDLARILAKVKESQIDECKDILLRAYSDDSNIYIIGNGGSAANASHFAQDLAKGCRGGLDSSKRFRALSLTDNIPFITALANDDGYQCVYEQQLRTYAKSGDVLIAISGSGNSPNIIQAVVWANDNGLATVGVTGFHGGRLMEICQHKLHVPLDDMCTSESIHSILFHYIILEIQKHLGMECKK